MKIRAALKVFLILLYGFAITATGQQPATEETLAGLFSGILNSRVDEERIRLNDSIDSIINQYVRSENIFEHRFTSLRYLGQITATDSRMKIITWNLVLNDGQNMYFCYLIRKSKKNEGNSIIRLTGTNLDEAPLTGGVYNAGNWYGALYYAVQPFRNGGQTSYAVLGLDYANLEVSRKIIDVISFDEKGNVIFGRKCFHKDDEMMFRDVFEYYSGGVMTLRFNGKKTIVFDNLVPISSGQKYSQDYYGSEFSFNAYILKNGSWNFVKNYELKIRK